MAKGVDKRHEGYRDGDPFAFAIAHRRLAWLLRLSVILNVMLMIAFSASITGYAALFPLKEVRVALVRAAEDDDRIYHIEPMEQDVAGFDILMEATARRFVNNLLEIDDTTHKSRFSEATRLMDSKFYKRWLNEHQDRIQDALDDGLFREIIVETTHKQDQRVGEWLITVDFRQIDTIDGKVISDNPLRAYVRMTTRPQRVSTQERYLNPLGITILDLTVKQRGQSQ